MGGNFLGDRIFSNKLSTQSFSVNPFSFSFLALCRLLILTLAALFNSFVSTRGEPFVLFEIPA